MTTVVVVILLLVATTAFYVAAEFAAVAVRSIRIQALAEDGNATAARLLPFLKDATALDRYVAACQIGITLSSLILGAYGQTNLTRFFEQQLETTGWLQPGQAGPVALSLVLIVLTGFHVVLGELLPKAIALRYPERVSLLLTYPMIASLWVYSLAIRVLNGTGTLLLKAMGVPVHGHRHVHSPEELLQLVRRGSQQGALEAEESRLLERAFQFGDRLAREVMVPRTQVVGLDAELSDEELLDQVCAARHSRFPVYRGSLDQIEGVVHVKDLVGIEPPLDRAALLKPPLTLPDSVKLKDAFEQMRSQRMQLVILIDEYGGFSGLLSMEDVIEQLVGDIRDEFDPRDARVKAVKGGWVVRGETAWRDVPALRELKPPANVLTVAGLLLHCKETVPRVGDLVEFGGLRFKVLQMQGTRILRVRIEAPA